MSVSTVRKQIKLAVAAHDCNQPKVNVAEARAVIRAAQADGTVSAAERNAISSFFASRATVSPRPGDLVTEACPESSRPIFTPAAKAAMSEFLSPTAHTMAIPESPLGGDMMMTMAIPENP